MSSSSSSGSSNEDTETSAHGAAIPPAIQLGGEIELAQICSFCTTFRKPLRLPTFSRTELQQALRSASSGDMSHMELLAELHFKLAREHPTAKMEKMVQDWEKTLGRKVQENWPKTFTVNPMGGGVTYQDLTVLERVKILDALCHWKLDTCAEIQKHIASSLKENSNEAIKSLRAEEIGTDDKGISYWYFGDECWVYAEDKPRWQLEERKPSYVVEFASAKRIRLSINFDPDHNASAPRLELPFNMVAFPDASEQEGRMEKVLSDEVKEVNTSVEKLKDETCSSQPLKLENTQSTLELVKSGKETTSSLSTIEKDDLSAEIGAATIKDEPSSVVFTPTVKCMDTSGVLGTTTKLDNANFSVPTTSNYPDSQTAATKSSVLLRSSTASSCYHDNQKLASYEKNKSSEYVGKHLPVKATEVNSSNHGHTCVVAVVGAKKRTIIDDDSSDTSASDVNTSIAATDKKMHVKAVFEPPHKKAKARGNSPAVSDAEKNNQSLKASYSIDVSRTGTVQSSYGEDEAVTSKETILAGPKTLAVAIDLKDLTLSKHDIEPGSFHITNLNFPYAAYVDNEGDIRSQNASTRAVEDAADRTIPSVTPIDTAATPETFDITCESCKKCYDMRYLDPPLVERPSDEWSCFECLVNDARGWPRRRKYTTREPFSPRADGRTEESSSKKPCSTSKFRSSSSIKKWKKSSSKSSSSRKRSSSSKRKGSGSKSSSSRKSSSKTHKKHKSSSSRHRSSSSRSRHRSYHRRRHSHYYAKFAKLVELFQDRQKQRLGIEEARMKGNLQTTNEEGPQGWRVVSSTLDDLRMLIDSLSGGSLEQDRLRGRLILIVKEQEKREEQRQKQQELAWNILPRRQSSRIAIGRMKNQSAQDSDAEDGFSSDNVETPRSGLRSRKRMYSASDRVDNKQKYDRAWRARRRNLVSDDDMDVENEADEGENSNDIGGWVDWSVLQDNERGLSRICLAFVNRLLEEEAADLFSRPVDPELDGCPNYFSVIDTPMDLGTIRSRAEANFYRNWELFKRDIKLVWQNCRTFNAPDAIVVQFANLLEKLSRSMCIAAEKKGVNHLEGKENGDDGGDDLSENSLSDASKIESHSSVNKAWTEGSASESRDSSDDSASSDIDSDTRGHKRRSTRTSSSNLQIRSTRSRCSSTQNRRSKRRQSFKKRAESISSSDESPAPDAAEVSSLRRSQSGRPPRNAGKVHPLIKEDVSDLVGEKKTFSPQHNGTPSPSSPPPPQVVQKRPKSWLIISDRSNSDNRSDSDSNSTPSSCSDSSDSDSDANLENKCHQPSPPPSSPPPPATLPGDEKPPAEYPSNSKCKPIGGYEAKKTKGASASTADYSTQPVLNSYLSSSSSFSSSDFSSGDSDSSDGNSDSY